MDKNKNKKLILAIESSADETAAAVLEVSNQKDWPQINTLSSIVRSQIKLHSKMGGIVPEAAARAHVKNILPVVQKALSSAGCPLHNIDYIAVTQGPGLIPSLIVGVEFARALALVTKKPIIPVNHMMGHLYSPMGKITNYKLEGPNLFPMIALIVSGGHTIVVLMKDEKNYKVLGQTVDDAAGEAFDKVAKMLKLPYPGGPEISKLAEKGNPDFTLPRPMLNNKNYDFSFSGLKTAVLYHLRSLPGTTYSLKSKQDICKAFQDAAVDVLVTKTLRAAKEFGAKSVSLSGGVSANQSLRTELSAQCQNLNLKFFFPAPGLSTDNAEMIGIAAAFMLHNGYKPKKPNAIKADSNLEL